jgi:hypothetical protein
LSSRAWREQFSPSRNDFAYQVNRATRGVSSRRRQPLRAPQCTSTPTAPPRSANRLVRARGLPQALRRPTRPCKKRSRSETRGDLTQPGEAGRNPRVGARPIRKTFQSPTRQQDQAQLCASAQLASQWLCRL